MKIYAAIMTCIGLISIGHITRTVLIDEPETVTPFFIEHTIRCGEQYQIIVQLDSEREAFDYNEYTLSGTIRTEEAGWLHVVPLKGDLTEMRWYKIMKIREDLVVSDTAIKIGRFNIN